MKQVLVLSVLGAVSAAVFQRSGIEVSWANCPIDGPACGTESKSAQMMLRILGRRPEGALAHPLGFAIPGGFATVYALEACSVAKSAEVDGSVVLGIAIGHEIGHVLLEAHSRTAIMQAQWGKRALRAAAQRALGFAPDETRKLRAGLVLRSPTLTASINR